MHLMGDLDIQLLLAVNGLVGLWPDFDRFVRYLSGASILKMLPLVVAYCAIWAAAGADARSKDEIRARLLLVLLGCLISLVVARALALSLPYQPRPMHNDQLELQLLRGVSRRFLDGWSSFPSDHAAFSMAMAAGIAVINRTVGVWALGHAMVMICLPRLYMSLHYPSDLLVGGGIGAAVALMLQRGTFVVEFARRVLSFGQARPMLFYGALFFCLQQVSEMFDSLRGLLSHLSRY
jgi:undecaprenyl-diphosphatase